MAPVKFEDLDATAINSLIANLASRLKGGLQGEFYEEGSRLEDKNRHGQLQQVFELNEKLSILLSEMQKQQRTETEDEKTSKAPVKANSSLTKTVESVVEQKTSDQFRDFNIQLKRIEERCIKAENKSGALEAKIQVLENKNKSLDQENKKLKQQPKTDKITEDKFNALQNEIMRVEQSQIKEARMQALESQAAGQRQVTGARLHALENNVARIDQAPKVIQVSQTQVAEARMQGLESRVTTAQLRAEEVTRITTGHLAYLQTTSNLMKSDRKINDDQAKTCARNDKSHREDIDELWRREQIDYDKIKKLEDWQTKHAGDYASFHHWVNNIFQRMGMAGNRRY